MAFPEIKLGVFLWAGLALLNGAAVQAQSATSQSGYQTGRITLESGDSVTEDIKEDDLIAGAAFKLPGEPMQEWFAAKRRWNEKYGLKVNFSYQTLRQTGDNTTGEDDAAAGRGEINGSWTLAGRGTKNDGRLTFRLENRHAFGGMIAPSQLGNQFGSGTLVGTGFSDFGGNLSELAWRQSTMQGRLKFVFGKISAASWYGGHALSSPKRAFQNSALLASASRVVPGRAFGAGLAYQVSPNVVVLGGIHDANGQTTGNPFDTIGKKEFLKALEVRWYTSGEERAKWDQVRLMYWHQDARVSAGVPSSQGMSFVASHLFDNNVMPFIVAGASDGNATIFKRDTAIGVGIGFNSTATKARDVLGIGLAWGEPSNSALQDQYTAEVFYRFQLVENFALTPSVQFIKNPTAYPGQTDVTVLGLRLRATF